MLRGHGDDIYNHKQEIKSNFSSNIYGKQDLTSLFAYLKSKIHLISSYPEPDAASFAQLIAEKNEVEKNTIVVTNGATEAIYLIAQTFRKNKSAIIIPTFSEYEDACAANEHSLFFYQNIEEINGTENLVWLCNPNNPTGKVYEKDELKKYILRYPKTLFVIDQSYESLTNQSVFSMQESLGFSNLILVHSMTKQFAIPGLRLGYISAQPNVLNQLEKYKMPWSVNQMALEAGHFLLKNKIQGLNTFDYLNETKRLREELEKISGLQVFPTETNFFLCQLKNKTAADLKSFLIEKGILIRDASNFRGLDKHYFRVAAQSPEENDQLVKFVKEWI